MNADKMNADKMRKITKRVRDQDIAASATWWAEEWSQILTGIEVAAERGADSYQKVYRRHRCPTSILVKLSDLGFDATLVEDSYNQTLKVNWHVYSIRGNG
jgi:hypothetical protein